MADVPPELVDRLLNVRKQHLLPSQIRPLTQAFAQHVLGTLFPHFAEVVVCSEKAVVEDVIEMREMLGRLGRTISALDPRIPENLGDAFLSGLPTVHDRLLEDAAAIFEGDPAAHSIDEVMLTYPGFFAIAVHRVAHLLHRLQMPLLPRLLSEFAHEKTGVDIHPGATIGKRFCIDHGTGVVIGETAVIGASVKLFQGVTLGALTVTKALAHTKRHPTLEDDVVIYAGATILGGDTVVGHHSVVAGNAWLTQSVPPHSIVSRRSEVKARTGDPMELDFII